ncbi:oxidoreductase [Conexibacter sp. CPCC 206217]|uniref:oxidoreductase n=1 Tax=Conexibacter sp. CPCC 206217 TaxID=3064574 RepID=UPI00271CC8D1|nr:oxidoreductase [Conexibacter sp. CPCC 206217]MDO8210638.1 oxidoreductase [Conexibacter sp. CPCC 206217]
MSKVWFITGSSRGLGRALAEAALGRGDRVAATARTPSALDALVARYGADAVAAIPLDVTDPAQAANAVQAALDAFGRIDVVVNNAGYANVAAIEEFSEQDFHAQVDTNLWGVVNVTRAALPVLRAQRSGHVIQISSVGGRTTAPGLGPYQLSKWAVEGFSGVLLKEVAHLGIRVTVIEPGGIRTDWAGASMTVHPVGEDYEPSVGMMIRLVTANGPESAAGDPAKMAQAILTVADADNPPAQLLLGSDAIALGRAADEARLAELAQWEQLSLSTDHDDETERDLSSLLGRG